MSLSMPISQISSSRLRNSSLTLMHLICFELAFRQYFTRGYNYIHMHVNSWSVSQFVKEVVITLMLFLMILLNVQWLKMCWFVSGSSIFHGCICLFHADHTTFVTVPLYMVYMSHNLKWGIEAPIFLFLFRVTLAISHLSCCSNNFWLLFF